MNGENVVRLDNNLSESDNSDNTSAFSFQGSSKIEKIESIIALFRNFVPEKPIVDAIIYFWESHSENGDDKRKIEATIDLVCKEFDIFSCEKYEVRTGYLSRYNYLTKSHSEGSETEIEDAIAAGEKLEEEWVKKCNLELPFFTKKDWRECIDKERNRFFEPCKNLIIEKLKLKDFAAAFSETVNDFACRHCTNVQNGEMYVLEELSWILSLPLLHLSKQVYLVHVGNANSAITALFRHFIGLQKSVKWLSPRFTVSVFNGSYDFLLDYKNGLHTGYSYAMENQELVKPITQLNREKGLSKEELLQLLEYERSDKNLLRHIIEKLPGHVYWLNRDNVYLGCNDEQMKDFGLDSHSNIIGKTNYDLLTEEEAFEINRINEMVMETGRPYEGEESASFSQSPFGNYLSKKIPLYNDLGKVIGLLGMSTDITDRKRAEELEFRNKLQEIELREHEKLRVIAEQVSHDIRSPLAALSILSKTCENLSEKERMTLKSISNSVSDIANNLLSKCMKSYNANAHENTEQDITKQYIIVPLALLEIVNQRKYQYKDYNVEFIYDFDPYDTFIFINGDLSKFGRMVSNLVNNAVESLKKKTGIIEISITARDNSVDIIVKDNGVGMSKETVYKIVNNLQVGTTKSNGYGIGLDQIRDTVALFAGHISVESKKNIGTTVCVTLPKAQCPSWIAQEIVLRKEDTVVVLDDDPSVFSVWKNRLSNYSSDVTLKYFESGRDAINFMRSSEAKDNIFLLSDYELRNQWINGIDVINLSGIRRSMFITNNYNDEKLHAFADRHSIKILPKPALCNIAILVLP